MTDKAGLDMPVNVARALWFRREVRAGGHLRRQRRAGWFGTYLLNELEAVGRRCPANVTYSILGSVTSLDNVRLAEFSAFSRAVDILEILRSKPMARVLLFGEEHIRNKGAHGWLLEMVSPLRAQGFTHYGVELLRVDEIGMARGFLKGGRVERAHLRQFIGDPQNTGFMAEAAETHQALFDRVKDMRMRIVPLSHPAEIDVMMDQIALFQTIEQAAHRRDIFMAMAINAAVARRGKLFGLVGGWHVETESNLPAVLSKEFGYESIAVQLVERNDVAEPFMVKVDGEVLSRIPVCCTMDFYQGDRCPRAADWIIFFTHVPRSKTD